VMVVMVMVMVMVDVVTRVSGYDLRCWRGC
jgi:hypothetical protein